MLQQMLILTYLMLVSSAYVMLLQLQNGRPVVYPAQYAHGSYHNSKPPPGLAQQSCTYFGEARGGGVQWDTAATATFVNLMVSHRELLLMVGGSGWLL